LEGLSRTVVASRYGAPTAGQQGQSRLARNRFVCEDGEGSVESGPGA
jgi:hypothetical protein